jgi:hypothetical protein
MLTGQSGYALPAKYRPLHRVSWRKACPFLEVQLPRFQRGGAAESDPQQPFAAKLRCSAARSEIGKRDEAILTDTPSCSQLVAKTGSEATFDLGGRRAYPTVMRNAGAARRA